MVTAIYLIRDKDMFASRKLRLAEVGSEVLLLLTSAFIQQCIRIDFSDETRDSLQIMIFIAIGLLITLNVSLTIISVVQGCKESKKKA